MAEFARGWVAMSYVLGLRGNALTEGLGPGQRAATGLARGLAHPDRPVRVRVLAAQLARLVRQLRQRRLV